MSRNGKLRRIVSALLLLQFTCQTFFPTLSWALTSGPAQPEFSSFEPVATTNIVDEFSGDFTYNLPVIEVPGPHGSSYPLSLSYHSGVTPEEEASWVGYGWTLNAGAINRGTRGFPDDFNGEQIKFHNKMPKNWTVTTGGGAQFGEIFGLDLSLGVNASIRYNNYRGFGYSAGAGLTLGRGIVSLGYHVDNAEGSFSLNVNPAEILNYGYKEHSDKSTREQLAAYGKEPAEGDIKWSHRAGVGRSINLFGSTYGMFSYTETAKPNIIQRYNGKSFNVSIGLEGNSFPLPLGGTANVWGSYTYQQNMPEESVPAYGYMYSANATPAGIMDYHVEKETDFSKRDVFLGIPFNDADNFIVSGEGLGGGFRMYNRAAGHFGPRNMKSEFNIFNVGGEIGLGWTFGPGVDVGVGRNEFEVTDWGRPSSFTPYASNDVDEPVVFRFNNDLGGEWGPNHSDMPLQARVSGGNFNLPADVFSANNDERTGRSSYIGFHTNSEINAQPYRAYTKTPEVNSQAQRATYGTLIGELAVVNESGSRYLYGLPVYNRNEKSLSFGVTPGSTIQQNYLAYDVNTGSSKVKIGQEQDAPYASTYLLTEITGPDYLDRTSNGPTEDDFGGYTRFNYQKATSLSNDEWYNWRMPYNGLLYNKNSHSDPQDDLASYSEGERQVYFLYSIETKTHVAFFMVGDRADAKEAPAAGALSANPTAGDFNMKRLDRIELYSLDDCEKLNGLAQRDVNGSPVLKQNVKPVKTVHFNYDYHLCAGVPNSSASGKMALTSVYFEYNGINRTMISPYRFEYQYPDYTTYPAKYQSGNDDVTENFGTLSATGSAIQNPLYSGFNIDAWGNYQADGLVRFNNMEPWLDQTQVPNVDFDPAAWHLKVIKLPSGGEIHIQYEQDDYSFVQDQEAHVMVKLAQVPGNGSSQRFYINPASVNVTGADVQTMRDMIFRRYANKDQKLYFKFLYKLVGPPTQQNGPDLSSCNAEFITGYASIVDCQVDENLIYLDFKYDSPLKICKEFVRTHRLGKLDQNGVCDPSIGMSDSDKPESVVRQLFGMISGTLVPNQLCQELSFNHSFLRVPTPLPKKGGGVRVKRLMMFSNGLEGEPVLYGNEYLYETNENGRRISSGVATNEPQAIREENILVDFVARKGQNLWTRIVAGRDKKQSEGPIGESVLPGPSVGYSKVIVKNIHSGQTTPGYSVSEYFTARDYPVKLASPGEPGSMTPINSPRPDKDFVYGVLVNVIKDKTRASQGFSFVLNNMHGQAKQMSSFAGKYVSGVEGQRVAYTRYEYFQPGESVPLMSELYGGVEYENPGREVDITFAQRQVIESSYDANLEGDLQIAIIPLIIPLVIPYPTAVPSFSFIEGELSTHAVSKVVRYPAIVKKVEAYQDGIVHTEENLAFDRWTGKPVAVKSYDEFKGAYLAQNIPASWEYKEMAAKWTSEGKKIVGIFSFDGTYVLLGDECNLAEFTPGDKIELGAGTQALYHVEKIDWAHSRLKIVSASGGTNGPPSPGVITIVHSGKTNQLQQHIGNVTYFSEQRENLSIPVVNHVDRYETKDANTFLLDLTNATSSLTGSGTFELTGIYHQMDMSAFGDQIPECVNDLRNAIVRQLEYKYLVVGNELSLQLMSFDVSCDGISGPWVTIASQGWE